MAKRLRMKIGEKYYRNVSWSEWMIQRYQEYLRKKEVDNV